MAGSIPILSTAGHCGRNVQEQRLGYKFLLTAEFEARRRQFGGAMPYCEGWARHNLDIFLRRQSYIQRRQTLVPNLERCRAESFGLGARRALGAMADN